MKRRLVPVKLDTPDPSGPPVPGRLRLRILRPTGAILVANVVALALLAAPAPSAVAYPRPGTTDRVSVGLFGAEANLDSAEPAVSADGRFVAFSSGATNLVSGDVNGWGDAFVRDLATGVTERVSVTSSGAEAYGGESSAPAISGDGRHVAFRSRASNLVPGHVNVIWDVFVRDRAGATEWVSEASAADGGDGYSSHVAISANGRFVAFHTNSSVVPGDTNNTYDVFVRDREAGSIERVSVGPGGAQSNQASHEPAISADGRFVAFRSVASNLVTGDINGSSDVFVRDRVAGATERVSVGAGGAEANGLSVEPAISADGRFVAFRSGASNLVPDDANKLDDVFVRDRAAGTTERVSVISSGAEANNSSFEPAISADGRYIAFRSGASNLAPGDDNNTYDVYLHDRVTGATERVSMSPGGGGANGPSFEPAISADGRRVVFRSSASNLAPDDFNGRADIFVRDRGPAVGTGVAIVSKSPGKVSVSGRAYLSGSVVSSAADPGDDSRLGPVPAAGAGGEITAASLTYRPEHEDLLFRLSLASLPGPGMGGAPGVVYSLRFAAGGSSYEVRAIRVGASAASPAAPHIALYRCATECTEMVLLPGGIGTTGPEIRVSLPLGAVGSFEGSSITSLRASTALGEAAPGGLLSIDTVDLPSTTIPVSRVDLGIAPASTPESNVSYSTPAGLFNGELFGELSTASLPAGDYRVWARGCLGQACGSSFTAVRLP